MFDQEVSTCSICHTNTENLCSNRPLHKGREITLLICPDCVEMAARSDNTSLQKNHPCSWCGKQATATRTIAAYSICTQCITLCRSIQGQSTQ